MKQKFNRRSFFGKGFIGLLSLPVLSQTSILSNALASSCPGKAPAGKKVVDPKSAAAKRLDFVNDATTSKHSKYTKGDICETCSFYKPKRGEDKLGWAPCAMLGRKYVPGCGWCKQYKLNKKKA